MRAFSSLLFIGVFFGIFYLIHYVVKETMPMYVTSEAISADIYLVNSKIYLDEGSVERGKEKLDEGIVVIKRLRDQYDEESIKHIDNGLNHLYDIDSALDKNVINIERINDSYILMLNALTYAQLREAEIFVKEGEMVNARLTLRHALEHIRNAIKLTDGNKRQSEVEIYTEIDEIIEDSSMEKEKIISMLDEMLAELENLEIELD